MADRQPGRPSGNTPWDPLEIVLVDIAGESDPPDGLFSRVARAALGFKLFEPAPNPHLFNPPNARPLRLLASDRDRAGGTTRGDDRDR